MIILTYMYRVNTIKFKFIRFNSSKQLNNKVTEGTDDKINPVG